MIGICPGLLLGALNRVYGLLRLYVNSFQPVMKLVSKTRNGANVHKVYDKDEHLTSGYLRLACLLRLSNRNWQRCTMV